MPLRSRAHAPSRLVLLALAVFPAIARAQSACTAADLDTTSPDTGTFLVRDR